MRIELEPRAVANVPSQDLLHAFNGGRLAYRIADGFALLVALGLAGAIIANVVLNPHGSALPASGGKMIPLEERPKAAPSGVPPGASSLFAPGSLSTSVPQGTVLSPPSLGAQPAPAPTAKAPPAGVPVPPASVPVTAAGAKTPVPLVADIQRELARRGYYDGAADGLSGPRTDAAIRAFEQAARLKATGEPSEALLAQIRRVPTPVAAADATGSVRPPADVPGGTRILAVQKSLARLGYGPIKLDGKGGEDTRLAILRFQRDRNLPQTGEISDRLVKELGAVSGAPVE